MRLSGKHILLGVTGGIAAYKAAVLLRLLQKEGAVVRVAMTQAATRFIGVDTMAALSRDQVAVGWFPEGAEITESWSRHIHWAEWADAMVVAPCTANTLADIAHGNADNPLSALILAARCPIFLAPTMDGGMYRNPAVQTNLDTVQRYGYLVLEPENGYLASGLVDTGRMQEPASIIEAMVAHMTQGLPLAGKHVVVTAGPTREYLDAVRFMSNPSSGKMGFSMAEAARNAGAQVTLVHGPVSIPVPTGVDAVPAISAADMMEAVQRHANADVFIMAAAVSDFRPKKRAHNKVAKTEADLTIDFEPTADVLAWVGSQKKAHQFVVGFAMETDNLIEKASIKRERKHADVILANSIIETESGFAGDHNTLHYIDQSGVTVYNGLKTTISRAIIERIADHVMKGR
jgi:phosphopantothenoylcysteine decarboxylase / phosphopantothenate---cysteine ligase